MHPIFELVDQDDGDGIRALLAQDPAAMDARDETGVSPFVRAVYRGNQAAAEAIRTAQVLDDPWDRLLAGESDDIPAPDERSVDGFTPLHLAAFIDNAPAAAALIAAGGDVNALSTASFARVTPLGTCAFSGALEVAKLLLDHGADPHIGEDGAYTVEAEAIARGNEELAALISAAASKESDGASA